MQATICKAGQATIKAENITDWANANGVKITGYNENPRQRAELQGQPKLAGYLGPMWNGDGLRYECSEIYASNA